MVKELITGGASGEGPLFSSAHIPVKPSLPAQERRDLPLANSTIPPIAQGSRDTGRSLTPESTAESVIPDHWLDTITSELDISHMLVPLQYNRREWIDKRNELAQRMQVMGSRDALARQAVQALRAENSYTLKVYSEALVRVGQSAIVDGIVGSLAFGLATQTRTLNKTERPDIDGTLIVKHMRKEPSREIIDSYLELKGMNSNIDVFGEFDFKASQEEKIFVLLRLFNGIQTIGLYTGDMIKQTRRILRTLGFKEFMELSDSILHNMRSEDQEDPVEKYTRKIEDYILIFSNGETVFQQKPELFREEKDKGDRAD